jgi:hypothetical protein
MNKLFTLFSFVCLILIASCTKIDNTSLGEDLIPAVDNVSTFATDTFSLFSDNKLFSDTARVFKSDDHTLGFLKGTTEFGSTTASIYAQFHPTVGFSWRASRDSIIAVNQPNITNPTVQGLDSAILCLGVNVNAGESPFYGDTAANIEFAVYRVMPTANFKADSQYRMAVNPNIADDNVEIGSAIIKPSQLKEYQYFKLKQRTDSIQYQIRIRLNPNGLNWVRSNWLHKDSTSGANGAFKDLASFTALNKGFVIKPKLSSVTTANSLIKISLANNAASRFEVWYKYKTNGIVDTANQFFYFNPNATDLWATANANYIQRTNNPSEMFTNCNNTGFDNLLYIESSPGSYAEIEAPFAQNFPNALIHKAELIVEEASDKLTPERFLLNNMYIENIGTDNLVRSVKYDTYPTQPFGTNVDIGYLGGFKKIKGNGTGTTNYYSFNITKFFQSVIKDKTGRMKFRIHAPYYTGDYINITPKDYFWNINNNAFLFLPYVNPTAFGRVVLGGGNHATNKIKLKVIYSKI